MSENELHRASEALAEQDRRYQSLRIEHEKELEAASNHLQDANWQIAELQRENQGHLRQIAELSRSLGQSRGVTCTEQARADGLVVQNETLRQENKQLKAELERWKSWQATVTIAKERDDTKARIADLERLLLRSADFMQAAYPPRPLLVREIRRALPPRACVHDPETTVDGLLRCRLCHAVRAFPGTQWTKSKCEPAGDQEAPKP